MVALVVLVPNVLDASTVSAVWIARAHLFKGRRYCCIETAPDKLPSLVRVNICGFLQSCLPLELRPVFLHRHKENQLSLLPIGNEKYSVFAKVLCFITTIWCSYTLIIIVSIHVFLKNVRAPWQHSEQRMPCQLCVDAFKPGCRVCLCWSHTQCGCLAC